MRSVSLALLFAASWVGSAAATDFNDVLPPEEFDKPYTGKLVINHAATQADVRAACHTIKFKGLALGCMTFKDGVCTVTIGAIEDLIATGTSPDLILRHEIGHCNGWGADHKGGRKFTEWAEGPQPNGLPRLDHLALPFVARKPWNK